jgi:hypothetical protein
MAPCANIEFPPHYDAIQAVLVRAVHWSLLKRSLGLHTTSPSPPSQVWSDDKTLPDDTEVTNAAGAPVGRRRQRIASRILRWLQQ